MVVTEMPGQRLLQDADLAAHRTAGHPGPHIGVALPGDQRLQHVPPGDAEDVADHRGQLDLGVFEQLLRPLLLPGPLLDKGAPVTAQIPQLPLPGRRHERRAQHPPLRQLAQPHRIQPAGLRAAGHVPVVTGIDHPALDGGFQQVKRRLPVRRGRLHHAQDHPLGYQPVLQPQQRPGGGSERAYLLPPPPRPALVRHPHAAHQRGLADIQRSHPRHQLSRLLGDLLHHTCPPPASSGQIPAAARRSQQGQQGGIACSRQQCRTLEAAPGDQTTCRAHSTKQRRRRRATTPDFHACRTSPPGDTQDYLRIGRGTANHALIDIGPPRGRIDCGERPLCRT